GRARRLEAAVAKAGVASRELCLPEAGFRRPPRRSQADLQVGAASGASGASRTGSAGRSTRGTLVAVQPLESYRDRFPILEHTTYLINHSLGAMPLGAEQGLLRYAREGRERGVRGWAGGWWETATATGGVRGRVIGAAPGPTVMREHGAVRQ